MLLDVLLVFSTKRDSQQSDADFARLPVDVSKTAPIVCEICFIYMTKTTGLRV